MYANKQILSNYKSVAFDAKIYAMHCIMNTFVNRQKYN